MENFAPAALARRHLFQQYRSTSASAAPTNPANSTNSTSKSHKPSENILASEHSLASIEEIGGGGWNAHPTQPSRLASSVQTINHNHQHHYQSGPTMNRSCNGSTTTSLSGRSVQ